MASAKDTRSSAERLVLQPKTRYAIAVVAPTCTLRNVSSGSERPRKSGVNSTAVRASAIAPRKSLAWKGGSAKALPPEASVKAAAYFSSPTSLK
jgi:hypothetical protein